MTTWHEMACPQCKREDRLQVVVQVWANITEDGTDANDAEHDWDSDSPCRCRARDWQGTAGQAYTPRTEGKATESWHSTP